MNRPLAVLLALVLEPGAALRSVAELLGRNEAIYEQIRSQPVLEILEDSVQQRTASTDIEMRNVDGDRFMCSISDEDALGAAANGDAEADKAASAEALLSALENQCDTLSAGWWNYEWCHRKHVRQFHVDSGNQLNPVWSLGRYNHSRDPTVRSEAANEGAPVVDTGSGMVDYFVGGQHCDETGDGRRTAVEFRCCSKEGDSAGAVGNKKAKRKMSTRSKGMATFASIREPSLCSYEVTVCTPLLCSSTSKNVSAFALLESLGNLCLTRHEGWWSYEFCYKRHVRQFHLVSGTDAKGKVTPQVQSQYVLGLADRDLAEQATAGVVNERDFIVPSPAGESEGQLSALEFEYGGGTLCELTNAARSATIHYECGATDTLASVVEDFTCHYKVVVTSPVLCKHPAFVQATPSTRAMTCKRDPAGASSGEEGLADDDILRPEA